MRSHPAYTARHRLTTARNHLKRPQNPTKGDGGPGDLIHGQPHAITCKKRRPWCMGTGGPQPTRTWPARLFCITRFSLAFLRRTDQGRHTLPSALHSGPRPWRRPSSGHLRPKSHCASSRNAETFLLATRPIGRIDAGHEKTPKWCPESPQERGPRACACPPRSPSWPPCQASRSLQRAPRVLACHRHRPRAGYSWSPSGDDPTVNHGHLEAKRAARPRPAQPLVGPTWPYAASQADYQRGTTLTGFSIATHSLVKVCLGPRSCPKPP
jgi:hypothetical protein